MFCSSRSRSKFKWYGGRGVGCGCIPPSLLVNNQETKMGNALFQIVQGRFFFWISNPSAKFQFSYTWSYFQIIPKLARQARLSLTSKVFASVMEQVLQFKWQLFGIFLFSLWNNEKGEIWLDVHLKGTLHHCSTICTNYSSWLGHSVLSFSVFYISHIKWNITNSVPTKDHGLSAICFYNWRYI